MKNLFYKLFALMFRLYSILPVRKNKVVLLAPHRAPGQLAALEVALRQKGGYRVHYLDGSALHPNGANPLSAIGKALGFFTKGARHLATAQYIFLNDNFMPLADLRFRPQVVLTQLWHAEGAFKKFGLSLDLPKEVAQRVQQGNDRLTYVVCSAPGIANCYAEAFGVKPKQVLALGSPRAAQLAKTDPAPLKADLCSRYPRLQKTKWVLYAPTFRDDPAKDSALLSHFDFSAFEKQFGSEYTLLLRLHPQIHSTIPLPDYVVDVTQVENLNALLHLSDVLITDYSSICMDFALLDKPMIFYAFDLESYTADRAFYFPYEFYVPGAIAKDFDALCQALKAPDTYQSKRLLFATMNLGEQGTDPVERIIEAVMQ